MSLRASWESLRAGYKGRIASREAFERGMDKLKSKQKEQRKESYVAMPYVIVPYRAAAKNKGKKRRIKRKKMGSTADVAHSNRWTNGQREGKR